MKVATFCMPDMAWFLPSVEAIFTAAGHEVRRCESDRPSEIAPVLDWCDVAWCEFANEVAAYVANERRRAFVVVRMHSYEAYQHVASVNWRNVDRLVYTAEHVLKIATEEAPDIARVTRGFIPSFVDTGKFALQPHAPGFKIGAVAWVRPEKNPYSWLQILAELRQTDKRYTLEIAGHCDFAPLRRYLPYIGQQLGLDPECVKFLGHVEDIPAFWRDKSYCLSSSLREGCPYNVLEAAACGVKPVVHRYLGADPQFPAPWLWSREAEAVDAILGGDYDSKGYRDVVLERYSLDVHRATVLAAVEP